MPGPERGSLTTRGPGWPWSPAARRLTCCDASQPGPAKETAAFRWGTGAAPDQIEEAIEAMEPETSLRDDMLRLIFTCCHPALEP